MNSPILKINLPLLNPSVFSVLVIILCITKPLCASWVDIYNTIWNNPGIGQWGSLPIGNGDLTANLWLQQPQVPPTLNAPAPNQLFLLDCLNSSASNYSTQLWQYDITTKLLQNDNQCLLKGNSIPLQTTNFLIGIYILYLVNQIHMISQVKD